MTAFILSSVFARPSIAVFDFSAALVERSIIACNAMLLTVSSEIFVFCVFWVFHCDCVSPAAVRLANCACPGGISSSMTLPLVDPASESSNSGGCVCELVDPVSFREALSCIDSPLADALAFNEARGAHERRHFCLTLSTSFVVGGFRFGGMTLTRPTDVWIKPVVDQSLETTDVSDR